MSVASLRRAGAMAAALVLIVLADAFAIVRWAPLPLRVAWPLLAQSAIFGLLSAVFAIGIVLVYRASRVINFAHGAFFLVPYVLFYALVVSLNVSYWVALPAAVLAGAAVAAMSELFFVRRFFTAPRLIVAVVTLGLSQLIAGVAGSIPGWIGHDDDPIVLYRSPFAHIHATWERIRFSGDQYVVVVLALLCFAGLGWFFRFSRLGVAVRGAAQNADRASELGVNVRSLSSIVWTIAGALAGLAAALQIPITGYSGGLTRNPVGSSMLVALAAGVIAGMESLPATVVAAIGISLVGDGAYIAFHDSSLVDGVLLVVIIVSFLVQRKRLGRVDESSTSTWAATEEVRPIPVELANLNIVKTGVRRGMGLLAFFVLGFPLVMSPSQTNLGSLILIDGIVVISLVILTGWGGQVSLGQYALVGVGAFVGGMLIGREHLPFLLGLVGGATAGALVAVVLGLTALRIRGLYLAVTTLAFAIVMTTLVLDQSHLGKYFPRRVGRPEILFIKTEDNRAFYYVCLLALVVAVYAATSLRKSRTGRVLIGMRDNERAAQSYGINLVRTRLLTFALSGFMAAAAGVLFITHERALDASSFGPTSSIQIFLTAVIGGLGSVQGALLGAVYFAIVNFAVHGDIGRLFASSVGVLVVLYAFPGGLGALAYAARDAVLRRIAIRRRIWVPSLLADSAAAAGAVDRAPLAAKGDAEPTPTRYRQPSRIRTTGASQAKPGWRF